MGGFWNRGEVGGWNNRSTPIQSQKPLHQCFVVLPSGWSSCRNFSGWIEIAGNSRCDFPSAARSDSLFLVFERVVFLNKRLVFQTFSDKKVGKMGGLLKNLRVLWYFYFDTHVQFLVGSLTKQGADMERMSHRILSHVCSKLLE